MRWGLYALHSAKAGDELLPFVGALYTEVKFSILHNLDHQVRQYAMKLKSNVYQDGDVKHGNVAGFMNSSAGRKDIANVHWECCSLFRPWTCKMGV